MTWNRSPSTVQDIMAEFADRTGLIDGGTPKRYLWTDAFAVCNFLELHRRTDDERYEHLALSLVDQVHRTLGRHRRDDPRSGWISGLDEEHGQQHPTKGGLRIGKELPERKPVEPIDQRLEWERDGQYYHYLTKWMHALNRVGQVEDDRAYHRWAVELAKTAHDRFTYRPAPGTPKRIVWKMSIDLSYPLVSSMGRHDPLDGLVTYQELQATAPSDPTWPSLESEIDEMIRTCMGRRWMTDDALGIGGLLSDAYRLAQLAVRDIGEQSLLLRQVLDASVRSVQAFGQTAPLERPLRSRLAFRELGLSIGLEAVEKLEVLLEAHPESFEDLDPIRARVKTLTRYAPVRERIESFWLEDAHRKVETWTAHRLINMVMLATSLAPDSYLSV